MQSRTSGLEKAKNALCHYEKLLQSAPRASPGPLKNNGVEKRPLPRESALRAQWNGYSERIEAAVFTPGTRVGRSNLISVPYPVLTVTYLSFLLLGSILMLFQEEFMPNPNNRSSLSAALVLLAGALLAASATVSHAQQNSRVVLLRGTDVGHFTVAVTQNPQVVITSDHAVGEVTSIGSFTLSAQEHINLQTLQISQAHFTLTAANGDHLSGTYQGTAHMVGIPNVIEYDVAGLISGGTGQFEGMSGAIVFHGSADLGQGTFKDEILGVVTPER